MIRQDDTTAKLQRAKERLYVLCQAGGWGGFFLLQVISLRIFSPVKPGLTTMDLVFGILRIVTIGWLITHYVRPLLTRLGWKELS